MTRKELNQKFIDLGIKNVYFQPPVSVTIEYPCLIYRLSGLRTLAANDRHYKLNESYVLTYVTESATDQMVHKLALLPMCTFDRFYTADELNHYVYSIYI